VLCLSQGSGGRHGAPEAAAAGGRPAADDKTGRGTVLHGLRGDRPRHALPWGWHRARDRGVGQAGTELILLRPCIVGSVQKFDGVEKIGGGRIRFLYRFFY
jgi:hypothetical protein